MFAESQECAWEQRIIACMYSLVLCQQAAVFVVFQVKSCDQIVTETLFRV